ncbi:multidrug transporter [Pyxidicoccus fallax]|uniref:Multidrug transporter n=1 Tax=Pyxidicoccus fallax TaxID=394095 RepID=A0A848LRH4_9BACT|nr:S28 family serine protease [Pyxidicoccus fallax]NMO20291.1 multidrug transporter [Pyxidicoccus fallax]NPC81036.1 multidrug transporter [Pyxidicoccus fallax]
MARASHHPRLLLLVPLLTLLTSVACGDDPPKSTPDSGTPVVDAGSGDAGTGDTDAGTDGGVACIPSGYDPGPANPAVVADTTADILVRLRAIPGLTVQENPRGVTVPGGYRFFVMTYNQPADHAHPECQRFEQRVNLLHTSDTKPMVLQTTGYFVGATASRAEPTQILGGNQLSVEHRFFPPSIPEPADWSHLTIRQSADDFHRLTEALKPIYTGKWVSTGVSKGGETVVFHRRFHPNDVDATVAYVAPLAFRDDARFPAFQDTVGGDAQAACRERLWAFQRETLSRRERMLDQLRAYAQQEGLTYTRLGFEKALEHAVIETYFAFWQYNNPANCTHHIPDTSATDEALLATLDGQVGLRAFSDGQLSDYAGYYYQAALELGWPQPYEDHLGALIHHPDTDTGDVYSPPGAPFVFRPGAMPDIQNWVSTQGQRLMFIYGSLDPWTAAAYSLGNARDSHLYMVPGGNHGARISRLPEPQASEAMAILNGWMAMPMQKRAPRVSLAEEPPLFGPRVPPRLRQGATR